MPGALVCQTVLCLCHSRQESQQHQATPSPSWQYTTKPWQWPVSSQCTIFTNSDHTRAEAFHQHHQETTVATGTSVKNLTYFVEPGKTKATGFAADVFTGAGPNFGKRISEFHIITNPEGRKLLEAHCQPSAPVYSESWQSFYFYCVQQLHLADANTLLVKERMGRQLMYVAPPAAPTVIWTKNLIDMPLAGFNINTPAAIHQDLQYKHCLKMPTTTTTLNTLVADWNAGCTPLYQSRAVDNTNIPFAGYHIKPQGQIAIMRTNPCIR